MTRRSILVCAIAGSLVFPLLAAGCGTSRLQRYKDELARSERGRSVYIMRGLALSILPRKDVFNVKEPVVIDYRITNVSSTSDMPGDISLYSEFQREGFLLTFELYRRLGAEREPVHASPKLELKPSEDLPRFSHYVKLQPGFFHGRPIQIETGRLKPGIYEMTARYDSEQKECLLSYRMTVDKINLLGADDAFVTLWQGSLKSNTIVFEVQK
ncbi:MAG TPA: hypothetical protein VM223_02140 [Planctomycetota bacterium]|nr:hypothetical protein [Planctomycetota bacterium]